MEAVQPRAPCPRAVCPHPHPTLPHRGGGRLALCQRLWPLPVS